MTLKSKMASFTLRTIVVSQLEIHLQQPVYSPLHPIQVENCDSNSRLVLDEDDNGKLRLERVNTETSICRAFPLAVSKPLKSKKLVKI